MKNISLNTGYIAILLACTSATYAGSWSSSGNITGGDNAKSFVTKGFITTDNKICEPMVGLTPVYPCPMIPDPWKPPQTEDPCKVGEKSIYPCLWPAPKPVIPTPWPNPPIPWTPPIYPIDPLGPWIDKQKSALGY